MSICYILYSEKLNRFYTGATQNSFEQRLFEHNHKTYGMHVFTAKTNDWKLFLLIECESITHALKIESHIKKMKSRKYFENLKMHPEMIEKLKEEYKI
jgi:putative endonuclease